ncbi:MAG: hypothetical protein PHH98_01285 [Candidatus Gracilibacteria bacterium]|nr:hypothetical protein [Candidatus Gracilibacteria bacterium]
MILDFGRKLFKNKPKTKPEGDLVQENNEQVAKFSSDVVVVGEYCKLSDSIGQGITFSEFIDKLPNDLDDNKKNLILKYMIESGKILSSSLFAMTFNIGKNNIGHESFIKGFNIVRDRIGKGFSVNDVVAFLFLYENPNEFYGEMAMQGFMDISDKIRLKYPELKKFNKSEMLYIINACKSRKKDMDLFFIYSINYIEIINNISDSPERDIKLFEKIFSLSDDEKILIINMLKVTGFFNDSNLVSNFLERFSSKLDELVGELNKIQFSLLTKKIVSSNEHGKSILKEIKGKILTENTTITPICTVFRDSMGIETDMLIYQENEIYSPSPDNKYVRIYRDKSLYLQEITRLSDLYISKMENNMPFGILLLKMNGKRNPSGTFTDFSSANDDFFEKLKKAA